MGVTEVLVFDFKDLFSLEKKLYWDLKNIVEEVAIR